MNQAVCNLQSIGQTINSFISPRIKQDKFYSTFKAELEKLELEKIANSVNTIKPTIEIFSQNTNLSSCLHYFFSNHPELSQSYQLQISKLPTIQKAKLLLQASEYYDYGANCYQLEKQQIYNLNRIIGQDLMNYAEVEAVDRDNNTTWVINDPQSINGTYVNGERIQSSQTLQSGDKITLGYSSPKLEAVEFIFEDSIVNKDRVNTNTSEAGGDIVYLILDSCRFLTESEQALIRQISQRPVFNLTIIQDDSNISPETIDRADKNLASIKNWMEKSYPDLEEYTDFIALPISNTYPHFNIPSPNTIRFHNFSRAWIDFGKKPLLIHQAKPLFYVRRIQAHLQNKAEKIDLEKQLLRNESPNHWQIEKQRAFSQLRYDKEETYSTILRKLNSSRNDLFLRQLPDSLIQKLDLYINDLEIKVTKQDKQIYLELAAPNSPNVHQEILQFCQQQLLEWSEQEWSRICNEYAGGGLNAFYQRSCNKFKSFPGFILPVRFKQSPSSKNWQDILQQSFVTAEGQQSYRSNSFSFSFSDGVIVAGMALINPLVAGMQATRWLTKSKQTRMVGKLVGKTLSYPEIQKYKLEQQTEQLKRTVFNDYQSVVQYLLNKTMEELNYSVQKEGREYRKALDSADELLSKHIKELEKAFITNEKQKKDLSGEITAFEELKRNIAKL